MPEDPQDWKESLSEDLRSHPSLEPYKLAEGEAMVNVPPGLVKSYVGQQTLIGRDKIPVPPEDATDEDWNEVWSRLGRPEKADGYELKIAEDLPDIVKNEMDEELMTGFSEICHKAGIIPKQAQMVLDWFLPANAAKSEKRREAGDRFLEETQVALKKEWGLAYDEKAAGAENAVNVFAAQMGEEQGEELKELLKQTGFNNHPLIVRFLSLVGETISEDKIGGKAPPTGVLTPEQATAEKKQIRGNPDHPYHHSKHPEYKTAVERMNLLTEMEIASEG